jgi:signal peptidase II
MTPETESDTETERDSERGTERATKPPRPPYVFLGIIAAIVFVADIGTKVWASDTLESGPRQVIPGTLKFVLAHNRGGAFGLGSDWSPVLRTIFFLGAGAFAVWFIVSLYRKLQPDQWAYKWGLPLVLGGALGNVSDRIVHGSVVDFIDYQAGWVTAMNTGINAIYSGWHITDHWPTFNVADIAICVGLILIIFQMFITGRQEAKAAKEQDSKPDVTDDAGSSTHVKIARD